MSRLVRIALAQFGGVLGDVSANLSQAERWIARAAEGGAQLVCFPELFLTGYNLDLLGDHILQLSRDHYEESHRRIAGAAAEAGIYVIAPYGVPDGEGRVTNSAVLYRPDGSRAGEYRKAYAFAREREFFPRGNDFPVFATNFGKIGIMICYDSGFPEVARALMRKGAEIIFAPSAWRIEDENAWLLNIPSRALENQLFTVGVNRAGQEGSLRLFGGSMACDPWGIVQKKLPQHEQALEIVELDLDMVGQCRGQGGYLHDLGISC